MTSWTYNRPEQIEHPDLYARAERLSNQTPDVTHRGNHVLAIYHRLIEQRQDPAHSESTWAHGTGYSVGSDYKGTRWPDNLLPDLPPGDALGAIDNCTSCSDGGLKEYEDGWRPCLHQ